MVPRCIKGSCRLTLALTILKATTLVSSSSSQEGVASAWAAIWREAPEVTRQDRGLRGAQPGIREGPPTPTRTMGHPQGMPPTTEPTA